MDDRDILRYERLIRVETFHTENPGDFAPGSLTLFSGVAALIKKLDAARVGQIRTPVTKATLLDALRLDLRLIARTARSLALADPAFPAGDYSPVPKDNSESPLLTHADAVLTRLEDQPTDPPEVTAARAALRARFLAYEIEADFVADLRADRDAIDKANSGKTADNLEGLESTSAISTLLTNGTELVTQLDAIMRNKYQRHPDKLHAWTRASRVERRAKPQKPEENTDNPPPEQS